MTSRFADGSGRGARRRPRATRAGRATATRRGRATVAPVRWPRVLTARARIAAGYYDRSDVQALVVSAVLGELRPR